MDEEAIYKTIEQELAKKKAALVTGSSKGLVARTLQKPWFLAVAVLVVAAVVAKLALTH